MSNMLRMHDLGLKKLQLDDVKLRPLADEELADEEAKIKFEAFDITGDNLNC